MKTEWYTEDSDPAEQHSFHVDKCLADTKSEFQHIVIIENSSYGKVLFLDGASQSAQVDEYVYHESLIQPAMMLHSNPVEVLILGGGEGASLREVLRNKAVKNAVMVDIDGELVELCKKHLPEWGKGAFSDPRAEVVIGDGKKWIDDTDRKFDVIIMDLTDQIDFGPSFALYTQDFFKTLSKRLNPGGLLTIQAGGLSIIEYFSHCSVRRTVESVFKRVDSYKQYIPSFFSEWSFMICSNHDLDVTPPHSTIDKAISERIKGPLGFYNGKVHSTLFSISPDLDLMLREEGIIVDDEEEFKKAFEENR